MKRRLYLGVFLVFLGSVSLGLLLPVCAAQSEDEVSLGDLARSLRQSKEPKEPAAPSIIDNDNLTQVIDDVEHFRLGTRPTFTFEGGATHFQIVVARWNLQPFLQRQQYGVALQSLRIARPPAE